MRVYARYINSTKGVPSTFVWISLPLSRLSFFLSVSLRLRLSRSTCLCLPLPSLPLSVCVSSASVWISLPVSHSPLSPSVSLPLGLSGSAWRCLPLFLSLTSPCLSPSCLKQNDAVSPSFSLTSMSFSVCVCLGQPEDVFLSFSHSSLPVCLCPRLSGSAVSPSFSHSPVTVSLRLFLSVSACMTQNRTSHYVERGRQTDSSLLGWGTTMLYGPAGMQLTQ